MRKFVTCLLMVLIVCSVAPQSENTLAENDCNWTMYGGNPQRTSVAPDHCTPSFENGLEAKWFFKTYLSPLSGEFPSPVIINEKIYIGLEGKMMCINSQTGKSIWSFKAAGRIESTPTYYKNSIIFGSSDTYVYRLDIKNGDDIWAYKARYSVCSSVLVLNDKVYSHDVIFDSFCLDATSGEKLWNSSDGGSASSPTCTIDGRYLFLGHNEFTCIDTNTGKTKWHFTTKGEIDSSPATYNSVVVFGCDDGNIYCLQQETGALMWKYRTGDEINSSPCIYKSKVYIGTKEGYFLCLDLGNGKKLWQFDSDDTEYSSATACNGMIYFGGNKSHFYVLDANTGKEIWTYTADKRSEFLSQPVVYNGMVYACSHNGLYCFSEASEISKPSCSIKVMPENLFFGKIARGKEMTLPFILTIPEGITGKLTPSEQWIEVSPSTFSATGKDIEGQVTIKGSALPAGESFEGYIDIIPDDTNCSPIKMKVIVKTDKSIQLKLVVGDSKAKLNDETIQLDVPPQIINGRTLIPVRFISESFGCVVGWDASSGKITISRGDFNIVLFKDKKTAYINGEEVQLDVPATIVSGRTLVPVRFISEGFGAEVSWDGETKTITIDWNPF